MTRSVMGAVALVLALSVLGACGREPAPSAPAPKSSGASAGWALPADASAAAAKAGLPMLPGEMLAVHYHSHLDVIVRGQQVQVPAGVGIDAALHKISPLHTHDVSGIVHIESAEDIPFTLGQFFTEWGQPLSAKGVGPVTVANGEELRVYRDGERVAGDPAAMRFKAHAQIVVWVGPADGAPKVPSSYVFPSGY